ncbi:cytochrome P450 [Lasiosphaeris hirsuta]|uniref:Cytochrome P450 n=1 Tax=Lasiosphaeris hirsuta TaxID=260670 RepID=A0AA39ZRB4_9PEZI|nr:cytochrome P450 [Lasiosphaeris hirsuta]
MEFALSRSDIIGPLLLVLLALFLAVPVLRGRRKEPPSLSDTIPFVSNTYQYLTNMSYFMTRAKKALKQSNIVMFRLGPKKVYLLQGVQNIQSLFRPTSDLESEGFMIMLFKNLWNMAPEDIARFAADTSGRYMTRTHFSNRMADKYSDLFSAHLARQPSAMAESAVVSLVGPHIFELNPSFIQNFWSFDEIVLYLITGPSRWIKQLPWKLRDRFHAAVGRYLDAAWANFDWNSPAAESDWEEHFGSRFSREVAKWFSDSGLSRQSARGFIMLIMSRCSLNSNTIPITTWALYEPVKDPEIFKDVRAEVLQAYEFDPLTRKATIDAQKLISLPLIQSVFAETLRLHLSINLTREVNNPIVIEGYRIGKGAMLQALTQIAHYDEETWAADGHAASDFWAGRHLRYVRQPSNEPGKEANLVPEFSVAGKPGSFVPFGDGTGICPGRAFAKQEVLLTLAMIVARFDVKFVDWTKLDGSPSDRPGA